MISKEWVVNMAKTEAEEGSDIGAGRLAMGPSFDWESVEIKVPGGHALFAPSKVACEVRWRKCEGGEQWIEK